MIIILQVFSVFLESSGNHPVHTFNVRGSDSVGSFMDKVRDKLSKLTTNTCGKVVGWLLTNEMVVAKVFQRQQIHIQISVK